MNTRLGWVLLALALGCGDDDGDGVDSGRPNLVDANGVDGGASPSDAGSTSLDGSPSSGSGRIGDSCRGDSDCAGGDCEEALFSVLPLPGGYCVEACAAGVCQAGSACIGLVSLCAKSCTADAECRESEGYSCAPGLTGAGGQGVCIPPVDSLLDGGFAIPDGGFVLPDAALPGSP